MWAGRARGNAPHLPLLTGTIIIETMRSRTLIFIALLLAGSASWAGIVDNVRYALAQNNFAAAEAQLDSYRSQRGVDGEYLEAYSWLARAALDTQHYDQAAAYAKQTRNQAVDLL